MTEFYATVVGLGASARPRPRATAQQSACRSVSQQQLQKVQGIRATSARGVEDYGAVLIEMLHPDPPKRDRWNF